MNESELLKQIQLYVSTTGGRVFRNNIGSYIGHGGHYIRYGVCNPGGSDLIGWDRNGVFLAIECKLLSGRVTSEQQNFINQVNLAGGIGIIARSLQDVIDKLGASKCQTSKP